MFQSNRRISQSSSALGAADNTPTNQAHIEILFEAAARGAIEELTTLLDKDNGQRSTASSGGGDPAGVASESDLINSADYDGRTLLHVSCSFGFFEQAKMLIGRGINVNAVDAKGSTALYDAIRFGKDEKNSSADQQLIGLLRENGAVVTDCE